MISIRSSAEMERALASSIDPNLRDLLTARRDQLADEELDLEELAHFLVVEPGDTLAAAEAEAGVSFSTNYGDGSKLGEAEFKPSFEYVDRTGIWSEAVLVLSDDGYGFVLIVPDADDIDPAFQELLARHDA